MRRISSITFAIGLACTTTSEEPAPREALALGGDGCTIDDDAELRCWGSLIWNVPLDWEGPGDGRYAVPVVDVPGGAIDVAVGDGWICALTGRGSAACWGSSSTALDFLTQDEPGEPVIADVGEPFVDVAVGWAHVCAATQGGGVWCWGENGSGQLGQGHLDEIDADPPATIGEIRLPSRAVEVAAGGRASCARTEDGDVWCWGDDEPTPAQVELDSAASSISVGRSHACAIDGSGRLYCWGAGSLAAPGQAYEPGEDVEPTLVEFDAPVVQVSAGGSHTCVVLEGGQARCWGSNEVGQLGVGTTESTGPGSHPSDGAAIDAGGFVERIAAGSDQQTCARLRGGVVRCWGHTERWDGTSDQDCMIDVPNPNAGLTCEPETIPEFSCTAGPRCCLGDDEPAAAALPVPL